MLDVLEAFGIDFDSLDTGQSLRLHSIIRPSAKPQEHLQRRHRGPLVAGCLADRLAPLPAVMGKVSG